MTDMEVSLDQLRQDLEVRDGRGKLDIQVFEGKTVS